MLARLLLPSPASIAVFTGYVILYALYVGLGGLYFLNRKAPLIAARSPFAGIICAVCILGTCTQASFLPLLHTDAELLRMRCAMPWLQPIWDFFFLCLFHCAIWRCVVLVCKCELQRLRFMLICHADSTTVCSFSAVSFF